MLSLAPVEIPNIFHLSPSRFIKRWMTDNIYLVCTPHWDLPPSASLHCNDGCLKTPFTLLWKLWPELCVWTALRCAASFQTKGAGFSEMTWDVEWVSVEVRSPRLLRRWAMLSFKMPHRVVGFHVVLFNAEISPTAKFRILILFCSSPLWFTHDCF